MERNISAYATRWNVRHLFVVEVQRRATRLIPTLARLPHQDRSAELHLTTLEERRCRGDLIEVFKLMHGFDKINAGEDFLKLETSTHTRTCGHPLKLLKPRHQTYKWTKFFSSRVISSWNKLPERVVLSKTVNTFKNRFDKHMAQALSRGSTSWATCSLCLYAIYFGKHLLW